MFLLDTNTVSELRKVKPHGAVVHWIQQRQDIGLFLSAATLGEIQAGIEITRTQDGAKAAELTRWLDQIAEAHNVLPMDRAVFRDWAGLMHGKSDTLYEDAMLAATARVHRLAVVTRNVVDFESFDVELINPFV